MPAKILEAENRFNSLLPADRPQSSLSPELLPAARAWSDAVWEKAAELGPMSLDPETVIHGRNLAANPVFIFGVHRSGTTLVRNLLDGHPDMVVLPSEGTYFTNLEAKLLSLPQYHRLAFLGKEWLRRLANPVNQPPYWLLGRSSITELPYVDFARYLMAWWHELKQPDNTQWPHMAVVLAYACCTDNIKARLLVDKTPVNERYIQRIWQEMPQAKIIHILRNPADILASRKAMEPGIPFRNALHDMKLSFDTASAYAHDPRFLLLRYEELCSHPDAVIEKITSFLDISNSPVLRQATVAGMPAGANSSFANRSFVRGEIVDMKQNPRNNALTVEEQDLVAIYMNSAAQKHDYILPQFNLFYKYYLKIKYRLL